MFIPFLLYSQSLQDVLVTWVTDNDIHVAVETYLDQMHRNFHNQNGIVVTQKQLGSINKENIEENRLWECNS